MFTLPLHLLFTMYCDFSLPQLSTSVLCHSFPRYSGFSNLWVVQLKASYHQLWCDSQKMPSFLQITFLQSLEEVNLSWFALLQNAFLDLTLILLEQLV
jgi:hypothetical protein